MNANDLAGHFLLAMPGLSDEYFSNALTYLFEHDPQGAMGLVVNRPCELHFAEVLEQLDIQINSHRVKAVEVLYGGPVNRDRGLVLHGGSQAWESTLRITPTLALTSSRDILIDIANGAGPPNASLILGYASWEAGQLEQELRDNAWLACQASPQLIFDTPAPQRLHQATASLGIRYQQLSLEHGEA